MATEPPLGGGGSPPGRSPRSPAQGSDRRNLFLPGPLADRMELAEFCCIDEEQHDACYRAWDFQCWRLQTRGADGGATRSGTACSAGACSAAPGARPASADRQRLDARSRRGRDRVKTHRGGAPRWPLGDPSGRMGGGRAVGMEEPAVALDTACWSRISLGTSANAKSTHVGMSTPLAQTAPHAIGHTAHAAVWRSRRAKGRRAAMSAPGWR